MLILKDICVQNLTDSKNLLNLACVASVHVIQATKR